MVVEDTGRGIATEYLPHIFDRFYRVPGSGTAPTPEQGLGLGLSFVAWIVRAHNGKIEVQSTPGKGTRFTITLPSAGVSTVRPRTVAASWKERHLGVTGRLKPYSAQPDSLTARHRDGLRLQPGLRQHEVNHETDDEAVQRRGLRRTASYPAEIGSTRQNADDEAHQPKRHNRPS